MMRKTFCLLAIAMLVIVASSAFGQTPTRIIYLGDVPPETPGSCGFSDGIFWNWNTAYGNIALGGVEDDVDAIDGKAYRIQDLSITDYLYWRTNASGNHDQPTGATIVARVKTASETDGNGNIGIKGSYLTSLFHLGDTHVVESYRGNSAAFFNDGEYHIIRLTAKGELDWVGTVPYSENFNDVNETDIRYVNGQLVGQQGFTGNATAAQIAIIGIDPNPAISDGKVQVTNDTTEPNAGIAVLCDPDSEGKIRIQVNLKVTKAGDMWGSYFKVYDRNGVNIANWMVNTWSNSLLPPPDNLPVTVMGAVKGRIGNNATNLANLKLTGDGSLCEMTIDVNTNTCEYKVDGVVLTEVSPASGNPYLPCGSERAGNDVGRLEFAGFADPRTPAPEIVYDNLAMQGVAIPVTGSRTIKLYLDEDPDPIIEIPNAARGLDDGDSFYMGVFAPTVAEVVDPTGQQDVSFDWIVGTSAGAFAPGEEVPILGYDLPLEDAVATTIAECKTLPLNSQVQLADAIISQSIFGNIGAGATGQLALAIESADRNAGIRVMTTLETYAGATFNITGALAEVDGERVIIPTSMFESGYIEPVLAPIAMNNAASGGGAFGFQQGVVKDATAPSGLPAYEEDFAYSNGMLAGKDSWLGDAHVDIAVDTGAVKITGGYDDLTVSRNVTIGDVGGIITVTAKVKRGSGPDNFWYLRMQNPAGVNLAQWMCSGVTVTGRGADAATVPQDLTGDWDILKVEINPGADSTTYFFNGANLGTLVEADGGNVLGKITIFRYGRDNMSTSNALVDDISASPTPVMSSGLNNVGLYVTVFGKVTWVEENTEDLWECFFYVDDGSGIKDGTGNIGIRCRPASSYTQTLGTPLVDEYVAVTGVMGIQQIDGVNCRILRTWSFTPDYNTWPW